MAADRLLLSDGGSLLLSDGTSRLMLSTETADEYVSPGNLKGHGWGRRNTTRPTRTFAPPDDEDLFVLF